MNVSGEPLLSPALLLDSALGGPNIHVPPPGVRLFSLARRALIAGMKMIGPGAVLAPACICREPVEELLAHGRAVRFYPVTPDLAPDWQWLASNAGQDDAALLLVHYFGVPNDVLAARAFCDERGLALVEDCAHSFLSTLDGRALGTFGDISVFSYRKILPVPDGGGLRVRESPTGGNGSSDDRPDGRASRTDAVVREAAFALRQTAKWVVFKSGSTWARRTLAESLSDDPGATRPRSSSADEISALSRKIIQRLSPRFHEIVARRRRNYALLARQLAGIDGLTPIFPVLPEGACPWAFPTIAGDSGAGERDDLLFTLLSEGVGAWTWPELPSEVGPDEFPAVYRLAQSMVLLPVHQDLEVRHVRHVADTAAAWALARS